MSNRFLNLILINNLIYFFLILLQLFSALDTHRLPRSSPPSSLSMNETNQNENVNQISEASSLDREQQPLLAKIETRYYVYLTVILVSCLVYLQNLFPAKRCTGSSPHPPTQPQQFQKMVVENVKDEIENKEKDQKFENDINHISSVVVIRN